jgi:putative nucleotidyltransferase with HDIG domain
VKKTSEGTLLALRSSLDLRDHETAGHCQRVTQYSYELAKAMNCTPAELKRIVRGASLHDIGKIAIPDAILRKPGPLTDQERAIMEAHVRIGFDLTRHIPFLAGAAEIVLTHHERFDGTGYPQGLAGTKIPLGARIFAVADTLDAMTRDRPYRHALPYAVARGEMIRESGHQFDPAVVEAFLSLPEQLLQRIRDEVESAETPSETKSWNRLLKEPLRGARRSA